MRRLSATVAAGLAVVAIMTFNNCRKTDTKDSSTVTNSVVTKVNAWLEQQEQGLSSKKIANVRLLKENLDFSGSHYEQLNQKEKMLVIPVREKIKSEKNIDAASRLELLFFLDEFGNIRRGNIVMFTPTDGLASRLPAASYSKMYNNQSIGRNGVFDFMSVTGRRISRWEYKDGNLYSLGRIEGRESEGTRVGDIVCINWYLVTTYHYADGSTYTTYEYVGTTCSGCDTDMFMSLCPDGGGSGSSGFNDPADCCLPDPNVQWSSSSISDGSTLNCGAETINPANGRPMKVCLYTWYYNLNTLLFWNWKFKSTESSKVEKENGTWKFMADGVSHLSSGMEGTIPPCVDFKHTLTAATPSLSADRMQARMRIDYTNSFRITCWFSNSGSANETDYSETFWTPPTS